MAELLHTISSVSERRNRFPSRTNPRRHGDQTKNPNSSVIPLIYTLRNTLLILGNLSLVFVIALFDYYTGPRLSFALFYLIPIGIAAWWGGFADGILISLAGSVAWYFVDEMSHSLDHPAIAIWNGVVRFGTFVIISSLLSRHRVSLNHERMLARTDPLTGAMNSRSFYESITIEAERSRRTGQPLSLAYFDLDNFKQVNDQLGHLTGDAALFYFVQTIRQNLRASDLFARLGGDEFGLLLPDTSGEDAVTLLTELRQFLAREMARKEWPVTVSIGAVTFLRAPGDVDTIVHQIDSLMYQVKRSGKDQIGHEVEKRGTERIPCDRPARIVTLQGMEVVEEAARVKDLSWEGIGLQVGRRLPVGASLTVENLCCGESKNLIARVIRSVPRDGEWFHGCVLASRLTEGDMQSWLKGQPEKPLGFHEPILVQEGEPCE